VLKKFIYEQWHPDRELPLDFEQHVLFNGKIDVYHSAVVNIFSPSDECGPHGMRREYICSHLSWYGSRRPRHDTVFLVTDDNHLGMEGMLIAHILLFFSYYNNYLHDTIPCVLMNWFILVDKGPERVTGMWVVEPETIAG
jgi:hypothetical protein